MANLQVDANIVAPKSVKVELVRAELVEMSTVFRIWFDVFWGIAMMLLGIIITAPVVPRIEWVFFVFSGVGAIVSLWLDRRFINRARAEAA